MPSTRTHSVRPAALALGLLALLATSAAQAQPVIRIADTSTIRPDSGGETFTDFGENEPVISAGNVSFFGAGASGSGIYVGDGAALRVAADEGTSPEPGDPTFDGFFDATWIFGPEVAFVGFTGTGSGVYAAIPSTGAVGVIAETGDPAPGKTASFVSFRSPAAGETGVAFFAETSDGGSGIYTTTRFGGLGDVADDETPIPGGSGATFDDFDGPVVSGSDLAFRGSNFTAGHFGLYVSDSGMLTIIADDSTVVPGTASTFSDSSFFSFDFDDGTAAFTGSGGGVAGIFLGSGGPLTTVVDDSTPRPDGGSFGRFDSVAYDDGVVLFTSSDALFSVQGGVVRSVLAPGDTVDGKTVEDVTLGAGGYEGGLYTVAVSFTDGSFGVYRGALAGIADPSEVPLGPEGLALLALALAAAAVVVLRLNPLS